MFLTIIFIHCYLAINLNENAVSSKCHICFNIDNEYIEIECFVFLCSIIKEKVYLLDLDISRKYFLNSNEEIFLTDEIYTKIVRIFSKLLFIRIKEFNFIKIDRENKDDEGDTMKTEQKNTDLFFSYPIDVKMPETLRNWTYNRFIESLDGSSYIYGKYENVVLNAFFKHKFRIDKEYMVLSIFFKNIQHYIDFKTYQTIQMDIDSKNINIDFENSFLYTDPNRLSAYLKNVIDFCYLHNIEHHSIFLKCSTKNFIVELLINSFQIMLNIKSNQNSEKEQYEFKKHLIKKMYEFLIRKIKVIRSKLTDFCILESLYPLHYQEIKHFMDLLDERCNLQAKEEDKEENSTNLRENNKIENTKMKKTADHKQLPEFNQSDSLESKNLNSKNKNGKKNKKNLKKDNFSSKNNFQAQKKEKNNKKNFILCISVELFDISYQSNLIEKVFFNEIVSKLTEKQTKIMIDLIDYFNTKNKKDIAHIIKLNIVDAISKLCTGVTITEKKCNATNNFLLICKCA